jgi:hypothetical protein
MLWPPIESGGGYDLRWSRFLSHFPKLETELELLGSVWGIHLSDDQVDALWPLVSMVSDSLASLVPSSLAHDC